MRHTADVIRISVLWLALLAIGGTCLADQEEKPRELSARDRTYLFQHRLIPEWTHRTGGAFFEDLSNGRNQQLLEAAAEIVSPEFSRGISIKPYPEAGGLLIAFPPPRGLAECYFIYVRRNPGKDSFSLFTYEKTIGPGSGGVVAAWTADGTHANFGVRDYEDAESFVADMQRSALR